MYLKHKTFLLVILLALIFSFLSLSFADQVDWSKYPGKPITNIIPYGPGGGSDSIAILLNPVLGKYLGTTFVNVYKPGASAAVGLTYLVNEQKADGYAMGMSSTPDVFANPIKYPGTIEYSMDDLIPLYNIVEDPGILVVRSESPFNTLDELLTYAKEHPNVVTIGISGLGGDDWIATKFLEKYTGIEVITVPFGGGGPATQAALGGHVTALFDNIGQQLSLIEQGSFRPLAVLLEERHPSLPDVPTMKELIGHAIIVGSARGYVLPAGTPEEAKNILEAAFEKAVKDPEFLEKAEKAGLQIVTMNSQEYAKYLQEREKDFMTIWDEFGKEL